MQNFDTSVDMMTMYQIPRINSLYLFIIPVCTLEMGGVHLFSYHENTSLHSVFGKPEVRSQQTSFEVNALRRIV